MSYTHFTPVERGKIELMVKQEKTHSEMARELGRHRTSIGRELRRNGGNRRGYCAEKAQQHYVKRRKTCRPKGRLAHNALREYVIEQIALEELSPELVSGRLRRLYPEDPRMQVCHETIYQAIYANRHKLDFLREALTQARPRRRKRGQGKKRRASSIPNRVSIHERPTSIEERKETGHWEGDTVVGKGQDGFAVTLVERSSRLLHAVKTESKRAGEVCQAIIDTLRERPISWVKSITFDNGTEFTEHEIIAEQLGVSVYFADPYSAYQRGSNEQVNGLLRRYLPKGTPFKELSQQQLDRIVENINNRPRKCLGYRTPNEVFLEQRQKHLCALRA